MDLKGILADHMGHFTLYNVPNMLVALLLSAVLAYYFNTLGMRSTAVQARQMALWAAVTALGVGFVRAQFPLAVALLALILLLRAPDMPASERLPLFGALVIGMGCGSGASLIVVALFVPFVLLARWATALKH
ncbi:MAG: hypothetical protein JNL52_15795 [Flavobacteriales bacterium]|nr:hypothetical protein [Flavobacteriales bacterium]